MNAALALRSAIRSRLQDDEELTELLGGAKVYDEVPAGASLPYVVLTDMESRGAGGSFEEGQEHRFSLNVWSQEAGMAQALSAANQLVTTLDGADLPLDGHQLSNLRWLATEAKRASDGRRRFAALRFRAVTEPEGG
ncbi:DUF3168 domain-containing protein [Terrihabitans sp. B22-R8]|uniref:DUF3168 domain-containing protein n=1 Tax=Terrihabitans sp. B22-R8 TaxID=3425128 RepID=UPI00403C614C